MKKLFKFFKEEDGATAVEYSIMVAAIASVIVVIVTAIGIKTGNLFEDMDSKWRFRSQEGH